MGLPLFRLDDSFSTGVALWNIDVMLRGRAPNPFSLRISGFGPSNEGGFEPLMPWVKGSGSSKNSHWIEGIYRILPEPGVSGPWICQSSLPGFFQSRTGFNHVFPGSQFSSQNFYGTSDLLFQKKLPGEHWPNQRMVNLSKK